MNYRPITIEPLSIVHHIIREPQKGKIWIDYISRSFLKPRICGIYFEKTKLTTIRSRSCSVVGTGIHSLYDCSNFLPERTFFHAILNCFDQLKRNYCIWWKFRLNNVFTIVFSWIEKKYIYIFKNCQIVSIVNTSYKWTFVTPMTAWTPKQQLDYRTKVNSSWNISFR